MGNTVLTVLAVALLGAIGLLVFGVGKIVFGIIRYYMRERKPVRRIEHSRLGVLISDECDETVWRGHAIIKAREIQFGIAGNTLGPDESLVAQLQSLISHFDALELQSISFLQSREPESRNSKLEFYMLGLFDKQHPKDFCFEFLDGTDGSRVWRIEFENGEPRHTGFDD